MKISNTYSRKKYYKNGQNPLIFLGLPKMCSNYTY